MTKIEMLRFLTKPQYDKCFFCLWIAARCPATLAMTRYPPPSPLRKGGGIRGLQLRKGGGIKTISLQTLQDLPKIRFTHQCNKFFSLTFWIFWIFLSLAWIFWFFWICCYRLHCRLCRFCSLCHQTNRRILGLP